MNRRRVLGLTATTAVGLALSAPRVFAQDSDTAPAATGPGPVMTALSAYMSSAGTRALPADVAEQAKYHLLDTLASIISGSELLPGQSAPTSERMSDLQQVDKKSFFESERITEAGMIRSPRLNLEPMFHLALDPKYMDEGEVRLVVDRDGEDGGRRRAEYERWRRCPTPVPTRVGAR